MRLGIDSSFKGVRTRNGKLRPALSWVSRWAQNYTSRPRTAKFELIVCRSPKFCKTNRRKHGLFCTEKRLSPGETTLTALRLEDRKFVSSSNGPGKGRPWVL